MKRKAGVYARVSTAEQATEGFSIDAQIERGESYVDFQNGWDLVDVYRDAGVSGAYRLEERPEGARLLRDAKLGLVDVAVFTKLDRFSRSTKNALNDFDVLDELGVEVVFIDDNLDTTTPMGRAMRDLMLTFATLERETIRDRNMAGRYQKAAKGAGWATGKVPFGYTLDDESSLIIDEDEAEVVRRLFRLRANGTPYRGIAERLTREGLRPRAKSNGEPSVFTSGSISHYIKQPYYKGDPIVRHLAPNDNAPAEAFEFPAPAIVDPVIWERANMVTDARKPAARSEQRTYGLAGRVWHEHEDGYQSSMFGHARRTGSGAKGDFYRFYRCSASRNSHTRSTDPHAPDCDGFGKLQSRDVTGVQADWVEARVVLFMLDKLAHPDRLRTMLEEVEAISLGDALDEDPDELRIAIAKLNVKTERWAEQYAEGLIDRPTRDRRIADITAERERLEKALAKTQAADARRAAVEDALSETFGRFAPPEVDEFATPAFTAGRARPPRGTSLWWQAMRASASKTLHEPSQWGRFPKLPKWVVEECLALAEDLDVHVILKRSDDPRRPEVKVALRPDFSAPDEVTPSQSGSPSSRGLVSLPLGS